MLDPKISDLARKLTLPDLRRRRERAQATISQHLNEMSARGLGVGGAPFEELKNVCLSEAHRAVEIASSNLVRVVSELGIATTVADLMTGIREEVDGHVVVLDDILQQTGPRTLGGGPGTDDLVNRARHELRLAYEEARNKAGVEMELALASGRRHGRSTLDDENKSLGAKVWDAFICHASEDKRAVVEPLAKVLHVRGLRIWYDQWELTIGDSLRGKIDEGLTQSRYGIVVLSPAFFEKHWPQWELDGLVQKEIGRRKVILPVWHGVTRADVARYSPSLADRFAGTVDQGVTALADALVRAMTAAPGISLVAAEATSAERQVPSRLATQDVREEEIDLLIHAERGGGRLALLTASQLAGPIVEAGGVVFDSDAGRAARYRDALRSLQQRGYVEHIGGAAYALTEAGHTKARELQQR